MAAGVWLATVWTAALVSAAPPETALVVYGDIGALRDGTLQAEALGATTRRCFEAGRVCIYDFAGAAPWDLLGTLDGVTSLEPDQEMEGVRQAATFPDVPGTPQCDDGFWELDVIGLPAMWDEVTGDGAPMVMVCDGGFLTSHQDLQGAFGGGWDYGNDDPETEVEWGVGIPAHGTFISGLLAGTPDNGFGRVGLLPDGQVYAAKNSNSSGSFKYSYTIAALADAAEDPDIRVVSYSLTSGSWSDSYYAAIEGLGASDALIVAAAGNCSFAPPLCPTVNNDITPKYPGNYPGDHVIQVGGTKPGDVWNQMSHYGVETVDLAAPGVSLCSLGVDNDSDTYTAAGTSYAAPLVAAVAALLMEAHPLLTAVEVADMMRLTAFRNSALQSKVTYGRVDGAAAIAMPWAELEAPQPPPVIVGSGTVGLPIHNRGGAGTLWLLVTHDPTVAVLAPSEPGWTVDAYPVGGSITLPDGSAWTATQPSAVVRGPVPKHFQGVVALPLETVTAGAASLTVSGVGLSSQSHWRALVHDVTATNDATGASAWAFQVQLADPAPESDPEPEPQPEALPETPADAGPAADTDAGASDAAPDAGFGELPDNGAAGDAAGGLPSMPAAGGTSSGPSGCAGGGPSAPMWPVVLLVLGVALGRRRTH